MGTSEWVPKSTTPLFEKVEVGGGSNVWFTNNQNELKLFDSDTTD